MNETLLNLRSQGSRWLGVYLLFVHVFAPLLLWASGLEPYWVLALALLLGYRLSQLWPRLVSLRSPHAIVGLRQLDDGCWRLYRGDGSSEQVSLDPVGYVHPLLISLRLRWLDGQRSSWLVLPRDSLDREAHRRLRVVLNTAPGGCGDAAVEGLSRP